MSLSNGEFGRIVASDVLDQIERSIAEDFDFSHVADVKQPGGGSRRHMLGKDARILDRHVPSAKIDHFGLQAPVHGVQGGLTKLCGGWGCHSEFSTMAMQNRN